MAFSDIKSKPSLGFYIQSNINYKANDLISLDVGIGYSFNRFSIEEENAVLRQDVVRQTSGLYVPLGINFHLGKQKRLLVGGGFLLDCLIFAKEKLTLDTPVFGVDETFQNRVEQENDIDNLYSQFSFGIFLQAKKLFNLSESLKGFVLLRVSQNINRFEEVEFRLSSDSNASVNKEVEAAVVNVGFGIQL